MSAPRLRRAMGFADVTWFLVVTVVGTRWISTAAAVGPAALTLWGIGFLTLFVPMAYTVVVLSRRYPGEGGLYIWTREAFGDYPGFLAGWTYWASNLPFFPGLLYFAAASALYALGPRGHAFSASVPYFVSASLIGLTLALGLNLLGLRVGKWLHNAGAWGTWLPIALLVAVAGVCASRFGTATSFDAAHLLPGPSLANLMLCSTIAFAFGGFETASFMGDEIVDAPRTVPRAILTAGAIVTAVYVLGTLAVLVTIPQAQVSGLEGILQAIERATAKIGLGALTPVAALMLTVGSLGAVGAWLASTGRLTFVAGLDHYLPEAFSKLHPRWGTPWVALLVQGIGAAGFAILGQAGTGVRGAFDALTALAAIAYFIPLMLMFAALVALSGAPVPDGTPALPGGRPAAIVLGGLGFLTTAASLLLALMPPAGSANPGLDVAKVLGGTVLVLLAGTALYLRAARRTSRAKVGS
jgi:amino acid transporter